MPQFEHLGFEASSVTMSSSSLIGVSATTGAEGVAPEFLLLDDEFSTLLKVS